MPAASPRAPRDPGADRASRAPRPARSRIPGLAIASLALLVVGVLTVAPTYSTYRAQQQRVADAKAHIVAQRADLADLAEQRARWDDPAYVRAQAGARLYYVMPGTTAYRVIGSTAVPSAAATPDPAAPSEPTGWAAALAASLLAAGTTDAPPSSVERAG